MAQKSIEKSERNEFIKSNAMMFIGAMYFEGGYGIRKDLKLAIDWIRKSADLGNETAKKVLANINPN